MVLQLAWSHRVDVERRVDAACAGRHVVDDGVRDFTAHATGPQVRSELGRLLRREAQQVHSLHSQLARQRLRLRLHRHPASAMRQGANCRLRATQGVASALQRLDFSLTMMGRKAQQAAGQR